jgi:hypothetical protein
MPLAAAPPGLGLNPSPTTGSAPALAPPAPIEAAPRTQPVLLLALGASLLVLLALLAGIAGFLFGGWGEQRAQTPVHGEQTPVQGAQTPAEPVQAPAPPEPVPTPPVAPEAARSAPASTPGVVGEAPNEAAAGEPVLLTISVEPFGPIWVDGDHVAGPNDTTARVRVTPGRHRVQVGPRREAHTVTVRAGQRNSARLQWQPR